MVATVGEALASGLPVTGLDALASAKRSAHPEHAHAIIMDGPGGRVLRFRVPT